MNNFNILNNQTLEEKIQWLDKYCQYEDSPWAKWFNNNYCNKCKTVKVYIPEFDCESECAPCELQDPETGKYEDPCGFANCLTEKIIEAWLLSEGE